MCAMFCAKLASSTLHSIKTFYFPSFQTRAFTTITYMKGELKRHGFDIKTWTRAEFQHQQFIYETIKMDQLKSELEKLGLSTEGTKTQLVIRYIEGMRTEEDLKKEATKLGIELNGSRLELISKIEEAHKDKSPQPPAKEKTKSSRKQNPT